MLRSRIPLAGLFALAAFTLPSFAQGPNPAGGQAGKGGCPTGPAVAAAIANTPANLAGTPQAAVADKTNGRVTTGAGPGGPGIQTGQAAAQANTPANDPQAPATRQTGGGNAQANPGVPGQPGELNAQAQLLAQAEGPAAPCR